MASSTLPTLTDHAVGSTCTLHHLLATLEPPGNNLTSLRYDLEALNKVLSALRPPLVEFSAIWLELLRRPLIAYVQTCHSLAESVVACNVQRQGKPTTGHRWMQMEFRGHGNEEKSKLLGLYGQVLIIALEMINL